MTLSSSSYIQNQIEQRERQWQTSFPAKVLDWHSDTNTVQLEPQFYEVWRDGDERVTETIEAPEDAYIDNVPVLFPRSGSWSITFPIETGTFGLVVCTKFSLDVWRNQGNATDPGDLRRFTMSGATFHPVNLHPNSSNLVPFDDEHMVLGKGGPGVDFVALKADVDDIKIMIDQIKSQYNSHAHTATGCFGSTHNAAVTASYTVTASKKVKVE
jgi:hypothetical protein